MTSDRLLILVIAVTHILFMAVYWIQKNMHGIVYAGLLAVVMLLAAIGWQLTCNCKGSQHG